jgi:hypothetical protein
MTILVRSEAPCASLHSPEDASQRRKRVEGTPWGHEVEGSEGRCAKSQLWPRFSIGVLKMDMRSRDLLPREGISDWESVVRVTADGVESFLAAFTARSSREIENGRTK